MLVTGDREVMSTPASLHADVSCVMLTTFGLVGPMLPMLANMLPGIIKLELQSLGFASKQLLIPTMGQMAFIRPAVVSFGKPSIEVPTGPTSPSEERDVMVALKILTYISVTIALESGHLSHKQFSEGANWGASANGSLKGIIELPIAVAFFSMHLSACVTMHT